MSRELEELIQEGIGYEPVNLSIRGYPEIRLDHRTSEDRDGLVERIASVLRREGWVKLPRDVKEVISKTVQWETLEPEEEAGFLADEILLAVFGTYDPLNEEENN